MAKHSFDMLGVAFAHLRIAQDQWVAQQLIQGDAFVGQQRMPARNRDHQRIAPGRYGDDAITNLVGLGESHVVQIAMKPFDLL